MATETLIHDRTNDKIFLTAYTPARYAKAFGLRTEGAVIDGDRVVKYIAPDGTWIATAQVLGIGESSMLHRL